MAATANMIAPPSTTSTIIHARSGVIYNIDANGFVSNVAQADIRDLIGAGFLLQLFPFSQKNIFLGKLTAANMNSTADQAIAISMVGVAPVGTKVHVNNIVVTNASISLNTAVGGIYTAAAKGGTAIIPANTTYAGLTASSIALDIIVNSSRAVYTTAPVAILSLTTPQGAAATADVYVFGSILG